MLKTLPGQRDGSVRSEVWRSLYPKCLALWFMTHFVVRNLKTQITNTWAPSFNMLSSYINNTGKRHMHWVQAKSLENRRVLATTKKTFSKGILPSSVQLSITANSCNLFKKIDSNVRLWCPR